MIQFGGFLILLGIGSFILNAYNYEFRVLTWIDTWGPNVGLAIRITLIVIGVIIAILGFIVKNNKKTVRQETSDQVQW